MIGIQFTITNKDGDSIKINDHVTNPNQVIALQQYPTMEVNIKNQEIDKEGQHGVWDFNSYYGSRFINFQGLIIGETEDDVEAVRDNLIRVMQLPVQPTAARNGVVKIKWTDEASESWQLDAKLIQDISFSRPIGQKLVLSFNLSMKAVDPFIVGQTLFQQVGVRGYTQQGSQIPIKLPAIIGTTQQGVLSATNNGAIYAHTTIRLYGEAQQVITNPRVLNLSTGDLCQINTTLADENAYVEINSQTGAIVDETGADLSGFLTTESTFILLKTGLNQLQYISNEDPASTLLSPTAQWTLSNRSTKI